ncbi:hypothetical protein [Thioalkalivibrio sulfidiphilus]|uniref:hypothetical protein n=1 Tax=Thioalkalivibrio sulfidiphilus TaxID=1033854 RepID=UPI0003703138|nr:hypothetical protein [Thioalkalivibrio sulfidiphilus]
MKALLITPETQSIEEIQISGKEDIVRLVGYETLESDEVGDQGDRLFFDEECFLRATPGRFQIDNLIPVSGKGVVVGVADDGATLKDISMDCDSLRSRLKFL